MVRARVLLLLALGLVAAARPTALVQAAPDWLDCINTLRAMVGLPAVTENAASSAGAVNHSTYIVINKFTPTIGKNPHIEDPALPGYTADGAQAGAAGDVQYQWGAPPPAFQGAIQRWMTGGFHWEGVLDPRLTQVGYGTYLDPNAGVQDFGNSVVTSAQTLVFIYDAGIPQRQVM